MKKQLFLFLLIILPLMAGAYSLKRVSVHDPSIVWEPNTQTYYIFGSHRAAAKTTDLMSWTAFQAPWATASSQKAANSAAFTTPQVTKVKKGGSEVDFPAFNAHSWSAAIPQNGNVNWGSIDGNMWAPDVIWNPLMKKWCMYLSINGILWNSSIILLTADKIEGPYQYQAPVVISGFNVTSNANTNYKLTDLELAIGSQASLPVRYNVGNKWGDRWPHCIDPCVFYDEDGKLWMSYGSWSGGIWLLELDENTGLRDYDVVYEQKGSGNGVTSDPYFGKKIAGGFYVSGEASYIEHIGNHYFLFVTNGGLVADGGYQMRVFRSEKPDGPYVDASGKNAIYNSYVMNYGPKSDNRGVNILGAYGDWGYQAKDSWAERAQGHNSILAAEDGRTYLVYHTRFQNRGEGHEVRVHQVFLNEDGWLVAAPFEYTGETVKSADIITTQQIPTAQIPGGYKLLIHKYGLNHANKELALPVEVSLNTDGSISGSSSGTWRIQEGTSYITIKIGSTTYKGVMVEQTMEPGLLKVPAFTALTQSGISIWGYKYTDTTTPDNPVEATWKYEQDFSSPIGLTIVGGGSFIADETFGYAYQNGGGAIRSHYLLLPEDVLSHAEETQQMTISFWVNAVNTGGLAAYTYAPLFTAYAAAPSGGNGMPMMALESRGTLQINNNGWCDFTGGNHVDGQVNIYHQNAHEAKEAGYKFVRNWLDDNKWHHYAITFTANVVTQYLDGEVANQWQLNPAVEGQTVTGLFNSGSALKYICLGGNQAWDWADNDAKFMFAKLLIQNNAMSGSDIKRKMSADVATNISDITIDGNGSDQIYDLHGRRVQALQKRGFYIRNGKKFIQ